MCNALFGDAQTAGCVYLPCITYHRQYLHYYVLNFIITQFRMFSLGSLVQYLQVGRQFNFFFQVVRVGWGAGGSLSGTGRLFRQVSLGRQFMQFRQFRWGVFVALDFVAKKRLITLQLVRQFRVCTILHCVCTSIPRYTKFNLFSNTCWIYSGCSIFFSNTKFSTCTNFFNIFLLVFCEHFRMGTDFVLKNVYQIQNFRYFLPVRHVLHAIRLTSAKANTQLQTCSHACSQS